MLRIDRFEHFLQPSAREAPPLCYPLAAPLAQMQQCQLKGLPEALVRLFSKRTDQIDLQVEQLQVSGRERTPRLVKWAVHATRKPKEHETPDTLYGRWRTEATGRGVDVDGLIRQVTSRTVHRDQALSEPTVSKVFDRLASPDGLTATAS